MAEYITVRRTGTLAGKPFQVTRELTEVEKKNAWRKQKTVTESLLTAPATIISPRLAKIKEDKATKYRSAMWHVIHIPTGLVIAVCEGDIIKDVKKTFEESNWTLKGSNTLVLVDDVIQFEMNCSIRYDIIEKEA